MKKFSLIILFLPFIFGCLDYEKERKDSFKEMVHAAFMAGFKCGQIYSKEECEDVFKRLISGE